MEGFSTCSRCYHFNSSNGLSPCERCGWFESRAEKASDAKHGKKSIAVFLLTSVLVVAGFFQASIWDKFAVTVIPLQIKGLVGELDVQDHEQKAAICLERKFYDCVEREYAAVADLTKTQAMLLRLSKFQMSRNEYKDASAGLEIYFESGGSDLEARYTYARALAQLGNIEKASENFEQVLKAKPDVLQITVIQNYVKMLVQAGQMERAMKLVDDVRKKRDDPEFMNRELAQMGRSPGAERTPSSQSRDY